MRIYCVCGAGIGTSVILARNTQKVLNELGIAADVSAVALANLEQLPGAQMILATKDVAQGLVVAGSEIVVLQSALDFLELKNALTVALS
jgi:ascorbate PTS system EIIB component